jgi:hypothetical protein
MWILEWSRGIGSVFLTIVCLDEVWCRLFHRHHRWERVKARVIVCDKCGREWRIIQ